MGGHYENSCSSCIEAGNHSDGSQPEGPKAGGFRWKSVTGQCHTDESLSGSDPEGLFPAILGHEGVMVVVGPDVFDLKVGDHVIPLHTPECRQCEYCLHPKTNFVSH